MSGGGLRRWVVIETGANQSYIFGTNRLRHMVGASDLVWLLGTRWVPEAAGVHGAEVVLAISGKALLLVGDPEVGRAVIGDVSLRALREAPGLEVTGVVGPPFDPALLWEPAAVSDGIRAQPGVLPGAWPGAAGGLGRFTHVEALTVTYALAERARQERPSPLLRDPLLPWMEVCRDSGLPAAGIERHIDAAPVSAPVLAKSAARHGGQRRMRGLLEGVPGVVPEDLDDLGSDGWIAVIHADGNGVGQVFTEFPVRVAAAGMLDGGGPGLSLARHAELLGKFTRELELATGTALGLAVHDAISAGGALAPGLAGAAAGTVLPVVVGGDDVTVVCHARFALPLVRAFTRAFAEQTAAQPAVAAVTGGGLTAAAGIAYVKPHHPFSAAYALAEELTASAKSAGRDVAAVDLHVAFESTLAELDVLRAGARAGGLPRHGGPYVIPAGDGPPAGPRDIAGLDNAIRVVRALSSSMAHDLREGLAAGREEYLLRLRRAARSPGLPAGVSPADLEHLAPQAAGPGVSGADGPATPGGGDDAAAGVTCGEGQSGAPERGEEIVRLLDAMLVEAISRPRPAQPASHGPGQGAGAPAGKAGAAGGGPGAPA